MAAPVTRYHGQLSSCKISEKTNDPILRKVSDGQTEESDFIGHCPTNVERPTTYGHRYFMLKHLLVHNIQCPFIESKECFGIFPTALF